MVLGMIIDDPTLRLVSDSMVGSDAEDEVRTRAVVYVAHLRRVRSRWKILVTDNFFLDNSDHDSCLPRICVFVVLFLLESGLFEFPCHTKHKKGGRVEQQCE